MLLVSNENATMKNHTGLLAFVSVSKEPVHLSLCHGHSMHRGSKIPSISHAGSWWGWALRDRRHTVFLIRPVLSDAVPMYSRAIVGETIRDVNLEGVAPVAF